MPAELDAVPPAAPPSRRRRRPLLWVLTTLAAFVLVQHTLLEPFRIPSESMTHTLEVGDRVLVNRLARTLGDTPDVGDVVVFRGPSTLGSAHCQRGGGLTGRAPCAVPPPNRSELAFIKRVVAGPGDTVAVRGGRVWRNGRAASEPFAQWCQVAGNRDCEKPVAVTVPAGHYFVMGDHREASNDSRFWGPVPRSWMVGRAVATYWPPSRWRGL